MMSTANPPFPSTPPTRGKPTSCFDRHPAQCPNFSELSLKMPHLARNLHHHISNLSASIPDLSPNATPTKPSNSVGIQSRLRQTPPDILGAKSPTLVFSRLLAHEKQISYRFVAPQRHFDIFSKCYWLREIPSRFLDPSAFTFHSPRRLPSYNLPINGPEEWKSCTIQNVKSILSYWKIISFLLYLRSIGRVLIHNRAIAELLNKLINALNV